MNDPEAPARTPTPSPTHFFLPDLCGRRAVGVVVLVAELLAIVLVLARNGFTQGAWADLGLTSLFVQWVALTTAAALCPLRDVLARLRRHVAGGIAFGVVVLNALASSLLAQLLYAWALAPASPELSVSGGDTAAHGLTAAIIGGLVLRYFYVQEQLRLQQQAELQARIQALQSRIRPHFLFNSMNIIASLIAVDPDTAEAVVEDLSDLFRASLRDTGAQVTLAEEMDLCRRYVRIEQLRLGSRLKVEWDVDDLPLGEVRIPLLTLQPLLENAVYHGIQPLAGGGTVRVTMRYAHGELRIHIGNPVTTAPAAASHQGNRMALENIRHRLQALYGPGAGVEGRREGDTYGTTLHYPFNIGDADVARDRKIQEQQTGTHR